MTFYWIYQPQLDSSHFFKDKKKAVIQKRNAKKKNKKGAIGLKWPDVNP